MKINDIKPGMLLKITVPALQFKEGTLVKAAGKEGLEFGVSGNTLACDLTQGLNGQIYVEPKNLAPAT